ncbi:hypothetical protein [Achromobacter sp.]|jgi:hypothetical protein|uniref:hypothetical protein n=1 Tax=Achromobacter sp. TaxID=134375 RepID=UPI00258E4BB5|nr:hypothetical protein [Achromobacter sp.]
MNVYAQVGDGHQRIGGDCPPGWILMQGERPGLDHVAAATGEWVLAPAQVPSRVTALQGVLTLNQAGQLAAVEALFKGDDTPLVHRLAFERAKDWERTSPTVIYMKDRMGWTDAYVDQLFIAADKLI